MKKLILIITIFVVFGVVAWFMNLGQKDADLSISSKQLPQIEESNSLECSQDTESDYLPDGAQKKYAGCILRIKFAVEDEKRDPFIQLYGRSWSSPTYFMTEIQEFKKDESDRKLPANVLVVGIGGESSSDIIEKMQNLNFNQSYEVDYNGTRVKFRTPKKVDRVKKYSVMLNITKAKLKITPKKIVIQFDLTYSEGVMYVGYSWNEKNNVKHRRKKAKKGLSSFEVPMLGGEMFLRESRTGLIVAYLPKVTKVDIGDFMNASIVNVEKTKLVDVDPQILINQMTDPNFRVLEIRYSAQSEVVFSGLSKVKNEIPTVMKLYVGEWSVVWIGADGEKHTYRIEVFDDGQVQKVED